MTTVALQEKSVEPQYPSKAKHADTRESSSSRTSQILPLGTNFSTACTFYERVLTNDSVMDIASRYNIPQFAHRNYVFRVTCIRERWG